MEKAHYILTVILIIGLSTSAVFAENSAAVPVTAPAKVVIHGKVIILGSSDPLEGVIIEVNGNTNAAAVTAANGAYSLETGPGEIKLSFSDFGYKTVELNAVMKAGEVPDLDVSLENVDFVSDAVIVRAKKDKNDVIKTTITHNEIKKVPGTGGDALRAVQSMPGVAAMSDYSSGLAVQGGGPGDNMYLLDSIPWPYPFHFGGILSTVYSDLLASVDLNTAGFGAQWGDIMGAVLDAKTRPGAKDRVRCEADVSIITAQALIESPIGLGDASIALYGRRSYLDLLVGKLLSSKGITAFPFFWDIGGTLDFSMGRDNHVKALALANDDMMKLYIDPATNTASVYTGNFTMDDGSFTGGFSWSNTSIPGFNSKFTAYYYDLFEKEDIGTGLNVDLSQSNTGVKEEGEWDAGEFLAIGHEIGFGADVERIHDAANVDMTIDIVHHTDTPASTYVDGWHTNRGGYLQDRMKLIPGLDLTAGVRYDKDEVIVRDTTLPRFCLSWSSDPLTVWKAAWGIYSQFPTDVQLNSVFGNPDLTPNMAQHTVVSVERKLTNEITARFDAYYKYYTNLVENNGDAIYDNSGSGSAKGVEVYLNADYGDKFFGWISYALSKSERLTPAYDSWVSYRYDQTNLLSAVGSYSITPAWSFGAKLHYNSGPLVQQYLGRYQDPNNQWHGIFSQNYVRRLDDYLRLDVRTDYTFNYVGWKLSLYVEILNILNRPNPAQIMYSDDYTSSQIINNLPMIPYIGVEASW
jgi:hypothetical protein